MGRKKQIFLQLYTKDYTGDERLRMCSPAAWGVYSYLLCLLNSTRVRGCYRLSLLERRPDLKRSLTQRCLSTASETAKIHPFAEILQRQMPWRKTEILRALKELLFYGVIVLEDDAIIQPRMYREGGHILKKDMDRVGESDGSVGGGSAAASSSGRFRMDAPFTSSDSAPNTDPENNKKSAFPAHAIAHARYESMSYENDNPINNNGNNKGEKSQNGSPDAKTPQFIPPTLEEVRAYFAERGTSINPEAFWAHYEANGWVQSRGKPIKNWKACLTTWEHRRGEFGDGSRSKRSDTAIQQKDVNFDDQETW